LLRDFAGRGGDTQTMQPQQHSFGSKAALAAALTSIGYAIPQILQVLGLLPDPWDRVLIFAPSLLLAPSFVCTVAAAAQLAEPGREAVGRAAFGISIMYAVLVSSVYIVQLHVVIPRELNGEGASVAALACCSPHMTFTAIDLLGYSLMSVSMWLLASALGRTATPMLRAMLLVNGWLVFVIFGQLLWPALIYPAAIWLVSFPAAMLLLRAHFRTA